MNQVIYVCGKISGLPDLNKPKFDTATRELRSRGYIVRNPHEICEGISEDQWEECMRKCIGELMKCQVIVLLDDFVHSRGATLELYIAREVGIAYDTYRNFIKSHDCQKQQSLHAPQN